jgi:methionyl-tRNA synthetase
MDALDLKGGAEAAWSLVSAANQFIVQTAPWTLAKQEQHAQLDAVLASLARCLTRLAVLTQPFLPGKAAELWRHLGQDAALASAWRLGEAPEAAGRKVTKPAGLFPKPSPPNP